MGGKMFERDPKKITFRGVGLLFIIAGIFLFSIGTAGWLINYIQETTAIISPSYKAMGGLMIMALGYIILEIELLRKE